MLVFNIGITSSHFEHESRRTTPEVLQNIGEFLPMQILHFSQMY